MGPRSTHSTSSTRNSSTRIPSRRSSDLAALAGVLTILLVVNVARSATVPDRWHVALNLTLGAVVLALGLTAGLSRHELGADLARLGSGVRWGSTAAFAVTAVVVAGALIPMTAGAFDDQRADVSAGELLMRVVVVIPLGTVLVEEVIFRGVLLALLVRVTRDRWAVAIASVLFGLWHVYPAANSGGDNALADDAGRPLTVLVTLVATTAAGFMFCWLRRRSGSLVAPILAHVATNSVPLTVAWLVGSR